MTDFAQKLHQLRQALKTERLDALIIPNTDLWQSEHPTAEDKRLQYICGLDASAGYCVITMDKAAVLIDDRYTVAAKQQIDTNLFEIGYYTETLPEIWAIEAINGDGAIGYDAWLHTREEAKRMQKACNDFFTHLIPTDTNLIDQIWKNRPEKQKQIAINHELKYAGRTVDEKLTDIAKQLDENDADSTIITAPDSIAWLLNLRTIENSETPGVKGFAIFQKDKKHLTVFTDVDCQAFEHSQTKIYEVDFMPLSEFPMAIHHFENLEQITQISKNAPDWFTEHLNAPTSEIITRPDPCELLKAIKNPVEQDGIRACHERDAIAIKNTFDYIKKTKKITEKQIELQLIKEREKINLFRGVSFRSIVGWNENGAKIHGTPTDTAIEGNGLLLIDSGAQYDDGTTDITRTIAIGTPTDDMKEKYTLVLKSHIALATAIFPEGTTGTQLDAIARAPLWNAGLNFNHGTGHGVGHFLNVHEGPCNISPRSNEPLKEGMLLSNEPGYYKEGDFGIRLENLVLVQKYMDKSDNKNNTNKNLLHFETVTKVPFDNDCIIREILSPSELAWLDNYQKETTL